MAVVVCAVRVSLPNDRVHNGFVRGPTLENEQHPCGSVRWGRNDEGGIDWLDLDSGFAPIVNLIERVLLGHSPRCNRYYHQDHHH